MKTDLITKVSRGIHKVGFTCKKHSPTILVIGGVVGVVTSAVMACKATTKLEEVTTKHKTIINDIHEAAEKGVLEDGSEYTEKDSHKDLAIVYARAGLDYVKLYGPAVLLGAVSITSILTSHRIMTKRNISLAAAYATVDRNFKEYRGRVIERFGTELDKELKYNIKTKEVEEYTDFDENTGEGTLVTKTIQTVDNKLGSQYAKFFDETCKGWTRNAEANKLFLLKQQSYANHQLELKGYLFLNEVYEMLGIPKTVAGSSVGWLYDSKDKYADNFVDFGIFDIYREATREFVNGHNQTILLDFNVQGYILDQVYPEKY